MIGFSGRESQFVENDTSCDNGLEAWQMDECRAVSGLASVNVLNRGAGFRPAPIPMPHNHMQQQVRISPKSGLHTVYAGVLCALACARLLVQETK